MVEGRCVRIMVGARVGLMGRVAEIDDERRRPFRVEFDSDHIGRRSTRTGWYAIDEVEAA